MYSDLRAAAKFSIFKSCNYQKKVKNGGSVGQNIHFLPKIEMLPVRFAKTKWKHMRKELLKDRGY